MHTQQGKKAQLKRSIGLPGMVFYGVGTMVGGGFYALLGKVVGIAGLFAPVGLLLSGVVALISALSFAELARRFPVSAGEAQYVREAFGSDRFSQLIGAMVMLTGVVSAATLSVAAGGFLIDIVKGAPLPLMIALAVFTLTAIAAWGVAESVTVVVIITIIETGTLLLIIFLPSESRFSAGELTTQLFEQRHAVPWLAIFGSAFLAFYAFIGFEDMVNMAEETIEPEKNLPKAIMLSVVITVALYIGVSITALMLVEPAKLAEANTPMALLLPQTAYTLPVVALVSVLAGFNGALVQLVMASRVLYGMASRGMAPPVFARINAVTRTPLIATLLFGAVIMLLALNFQLRGLAEVTSFFILCIFAMVNLALAVLQYRDRGIGGHTVLPALGCASCLGMLVFRALY